MYKDFEYNAVMELKQDLEITAVNAGALATKLAQFSSGAIYDETGAWHRLHDEKLDALEEIIEAANGQSVLIFYWFKHDLDRIKQRIKNCRELHKPEDVNDWNAGKIPILLAHPMSAGHGLNLQTGGSMAVWFTLPYGLEFYQQANKRLHRQGQINTVIIHHIICPGTIDDDIMQALKNKTDVQNSLLKAVKALVEEYSEKSLENIW
jgi:SNF2 family DNA or RNA helicase